MRQVARFIALPGSDRRLLVEAVATLMLVRVGLRLLAIDRLRIWARHMKAGGRSVDSITWAMRAASRRLPGTTCLGSALALQRRLSSEGHPSELHIGVARQADSFAAHAWLTCEGRVLVGEEGQGEYTRLLAWRAGGADTPAAGEPG